MSEHSDDLAHLYYRIAGLTLALSGQELSAVQDALPSFRDFLSKKGPDDRVISEISLHRARRDYDLSQGKLLSDISITWGNRFRFYQLPDGFLTLVKSDDQKTMWQMFSSFDFKTCSIHFGTLATEGTNILSWLLMVVFAQSSLSQKTVLIHASVVERSGDAFAFLGKSGTGKSTHSQLWIRNLSGFQLLNDDNPAIQIRSDQEVMIYGTPWSGKTPCYRNQGAVLKGLLRLRQAEKNSFNFKKNKEALIAVLPSCSALRWNPVLFSNMTDILIEVIQLVRVGQLDCLPNADAAKLAYTELVINYN